AKPVCVKPTDKSQVTAVFDQTMQLEPRFSLDEDYRLSPQIKFSPNRIKYVTYSLQKSWDKTANWTGTANIQDATEKLSFHFNQSETVFLQTCTPEQIAAPVLHTTINGPTASTGNANGSQDKVTQEHQEQAKKECNTSGT